MKSAILLVVGDIQFLAELLVATPSVVLSAAERRVIEAVGSDGDGAKKSSRFGRGALHPAAAAAFRPPQASNTPAPGSPSQCLGRRRPIRSSARSSDAGPGAPRATSSRKRCLASRNAQTRSSHPPLAHLMRRTK